MVSSNCIFCKIAAGDIPAAKLYEDADIVAFDDVQPQSPVHFLIIPKKHIETMDDILETDVPIIGKMIFRASVLARQKGLGISGYRQIINCRADGGQVINHLHLHIMGGRRMEKMG
jgi:histidine triad (HIT) family protein